MLQYTLHSVHWKQILPIENFGGVFVISQPSEGNLADCCLFSTTGAVALNRQLVLRTAMTVPESRVCVNGTVGRSHGTSAFLVRSEGWPLSLSGATVMSFFMFFSFDLCQF